MAESCGPVSKPFDSARPPTASNFEIARLAAWPRGHRRGDRGGRGFSWRAPARSGPSILPAIQARSDYGGALHKCDIDARACLNNSVIIAGIVLGQRREFRARAREAYFSVRNGNYVNEAGT